MTGEEIFRSMCHSFDKDGNTLPPKNTYATLSDEEKLALHRWRDDVLCEEFAEESARFEQVVYPLRPHNDKRFRFNEKGEIICPTFYDGCNCQPDHTQEDWNNLNAELDAIKTENKILREMDAERMSRIVPLTRLAEILTEENQRVKDDNRDLFSGIVELEEKISRLNELAVIAWQVFGENMKPSHRDKFRREYEQIVSQKLMEVN